MLRSLLLVLLCGSPCVEGTASIIVIANHAGSTVEFQVLPPGGQPRTQSLDDGDSTPVVFQATDRIGFRSGGAAKSYQAVPGEIYYFGRTPQGDLDFGQIGLSTSLPAALPATDAPAETHAITVIKVKILYDDAEVLAPAAWERRMRARFVEASRIFKRHCFVEFQIDSIGSWHTVSATASLEESLADFERAVDPAPARLAIGFTGQKQRQVPDRHLGGTRWPLHTHLLIREHMNQNSEAERLEVLVHELGHFLGAAHSPESTSVMRAKLGDRQARLVKFHIGFDPLNTMALCLVSPQLAAQPPAGLAELPLTKKVQLARIYIDLARALPKDPTAVKFLSKLGTIRQPVGAP